MKEIGLDEEECIISRVEGRESCPISEAVVVVAHPVP